MCAKVRASIRTGRDDVLVGLEDDVRDLADESRDAEAGGVDDLDPLDIGGCDALQFSDRAAGLVGDPLRR